MTLHHTKVPTYLDLHKFELTEPERERSFKLTSSSSASPLVSRKHHQTYVTGLNAAEESFGSAFSKGDVKEQIKLQAALKFNGGGTSSSFPLLISLNLGLPSDLVGSSLRSFVVRRSTRLTHSFFTLVFAGHINHSLFWKNLAPAGSTTLKEGAFKKAIEKTFGSVAGSFLFRSPNSPRLRFA